MGTDAWQRELVSRGRAVGPCTEAFYRQRYAVVRGVLEGVGSEHLAEYDAKVDQYCEVGGLDGLCVCLNRLVEAEMDYITSGNRGLGRASTQIPRLGARFRRQMQSLGDGDFDELAGRVAAVMVGGHRGALMFGNASVGAPVIGDPEELFRRWTPRIYAEPVSNMTEGEGNVVDTGVSDGYDRLEAALEKGGMRERRLLGGKKLPTMLAYYAAAGFILRVIEVHGPQ
jgi:hypothetical protein